MKTTNNEIKTYAAKSSVSRWAKKELGPDWKEQGTIESNEDGKFFFLPTPAQAEKDEKDDGLLHKSTVASPCQVVWDIAEQMEGAKRKDILAACVEAGIAFYTARTQYQKYREAVKASKEAVVVDKAA